MFNPVKPNGASRFLNCPNGVRSDRCLTPPRAIVQPVLCVFSDTSEDAFGACAYARWQLSTGGFNARFIAAKSRVAPLKKLTIPRLELQGAVLASRLSETILKESRLKFEKSVFFLDSIGKTKEKPLGPGYPKSKSSGISFGRAGSWITNMGDSQEIVIVMSCHVIYILRFDGTAMSKLNRNGSVHTAPKESKNATIAGHFGFVFEES